jgi:hypothetical protein
LQRQTPAVPPEGVSAGWSVGSAIALRRIAALSQNQTLPHALAPWLSPLTLTMQSRVKNNDSLHSGADLFQHDPREGSIRQKEGPRVAAFPATLLGLLQSATATRFADTAQDVLYRVGYESALQEMLALAQSMRKNYEAGDFDFWQTDLEVRLETWWAPHRAAGWGSVTFDLTGLSRGVAIMALRETAVAATSVGAKRPVCHFYAGLFAGALSFCERGERHAAEVECSAAGGSACRFVVGSGAEVDSAEAWRKQGVPPAEIIRRLH